LAIGAIFASGLAVSALAPLLVVFLSRAMGWRTVLMVTGLPTAIIALLCVLAWPSPPRSEVYRGVSTAAIASTAMLAVGLFCAAPISYFVTGWLPTYLRTIHHVGLATSGTASALVLAAGCCGGLLAGAIACAVATSSKKRAAMLTACGCLLPVVALSGIVQDWRISMALAALSFAAYQGWYTLLYSAVADTLPARGVAVAAAIGALSLGLSGIATPAVFGQLINGAGGFQPVFPMLAATALGGLLSAGLLAWLVRMEPVG
jgi:sugar phosphate permease